MTCRAFLPNFQCAAIALLLTGGAENTATAVAARWLTVPKGQEVLKSSGFNDQSSADGSLGQVRVRAEVLTPELRTKFEMRPDDQSVSVVVVSSVGIDSAAYAAGIRRGDVIWGVATDSGIAKVETEAEFSSAVTVCGSGCLISVRHSDSQGKNGFSPVGS